MTILLASVVVLAITIAAMAVGYVFMRKPIKGSCGGLSTMASIGLSGPCDICGEDPKTCKKRKDNS